MTDSAVGFYMRCPANVLHGPFETEAERDAYRDGLTMARAVWLEGRYGLDPSGVVEEPGPPSAIFAHDEDGNMLDSVVAWAVPADAAVARYVLAQAVDDDGRSGLTWFRLNNGDLILGVYPRGATYERTESDQHRDDLAVPIPLETLERAKLQPATWPIERLKDGYHSCVNHTLQLATTSFMRADMMRKNADIVRVTPTTVAGMRRRYLENFTS
ncbi:hypothetical protein KABACHOK_05440 [Brevundimonas phage vB_BpoS-Kabachok]|uniref:Uncharacterized protein n=2 Tax=Marchewkavirus TaxID=3425052 RepID=A0A9E7MQP5_9CAUD|nr:hypothetical protein KABACHOK_05440 [Brevundimonas phage vB_BpoS-Kabachok]USN14490.1 hypothetical protein DOMOVOI_00150 [Brevundimonas phage vB_BpoS-Domovoi]